MNTEQVFEVCALLGELVGEISVERLRQLTAEGFTLEHDDAKTDGELAGMASAYALAAAALASGTIEQSSIAVPPPMWPADRADSWKPRDARRNLVICAALALAEIQRIDREAEKARPAS